MPHRRLWFLVLASFLVLAPAISTADEDADRIAKLIAQLGSRKLPERQEATKALEEIGEPALAALRKAAKEDQDPEVRQRAGVLADAIDGRFESARNFAKHTLKVTRLVHESYVFEINHGQLCEWVVRGLFAQLKEEVPAALEKRLKTVKDLKDEELGVLLKDARVALGNHKELDKNKDFLLAVSALMARLDPFCSFTDRDNIYEFLKDGVVVGFGFNPVGIGAQVRIDPKAQMAQVITPIKDSPAYKAGIRADDIIEEFVEKEDQTGEALDPPLVTATKGLTIEQVVRKLLGRPGSKIGLRIRREGVEKPLEFEVARAIVNPETVLGSKRKDDDSPDFFIDREKMLGYIRLTQFSKNTTKELTQAVKQLEADGVKGLVLDLRFNPGGLLQSAVEVSDLFIDDGLILTIHPRVGKEAIFSGEHEGSRLDFPMAVLLNGESASASEIVGACLQDHKRALVIGERSRGKGSVQNIMDMDLGQLKLTTAYFTRPSGKKIDRMKLPKFDEDEWGVTPDKSYGLDLPDKEQQQLQEYLRRQTILARRDRPLNDDGFKDRQLELALKYLRSQMKKS